MSRYCLPRDPNRPLSTQEPSPKTFRRKVLRPRKAPNMKPSSKPTAKVLNLKPTPKSTPKPGSQYKANFFRIIERDPRLDETCALVLRSGLSPREISARITRLSGGGAYVSSRTIYNWLNNPNQNRALNYGLDWVERALGYERKLIHIGYKEPKQ